MTTDTPNPTPQNSLGGIQHLSELVDIVAKETGALEMPDADEDSVGWSDAGPLPMTFGHVRRAAAAVRTLAAKNSPSDRVCQEADGCPTEMAVLKRFWRQHQVQLSTNPMMEGDQL